MTGFGTADGEVGGGRVTVEVRSVNHRFFNPSIKLPSVLSRWEGEVRDAMRRGVARGHVTLFAKLERDADSGENALSIDHERFAAYVAQLRALEHQYDLVPSLDVAAILRLPGVFETGAREELTADAGATLLNVVERAVGALVAMRGSEGARLVAYIEERLSVIGAALARISARAPERVIEQRDRMRASVRELADGIAIDENRVAQEIAMLADRSDLQEELSRFDAHMVAFRTALESEHADGVGKRLGFLLQEMLREANTMGSKGNDSAIIGEVLVVKEELERIREQVENLE